MVMQPSEPTTPHTACRDPKITNGLLPTSLLTCSARYKATTMLMRMGGRFSIVCYSAIIPAVELAGAVRKIAGFGR